MSLVSTTAAADDVLKYPAATDFGDSDNDSNCGMPSQSHHADTSRRKRRRGVIEKKRRDRINNCLAELRFLVPLAFEKQGAQKLEKAEILQMTVDYIKHYMRQQTDAPTTRQPSAPADDERLLGFRVCASEVSRYLVEEAAPDEAACQLRSRLLSHLQCFGAQRPTYAPAAAYQPVWGGDGGAPPHCAMQAYALPPHMPVKSDLSHSAQFVGTDIFGRSPCSLPTSQYASL